MELELECGGEGGFEMADYSKASEWERLVGAVEEALRRWGVDGGEGRRGGDNPATETLAGARRKYVLRYHWSEARPDGASLMDMMESVSDFSSYGHPLSRWFGFQSFATLESGAGDITDVGEAALLLSTLAVAADNARVTALPLFVAYGRARPRDYLGHMPAFGGARAVRFTCKAAAPPRGSTVTLPWLTGYFAARLAQHRPRLPTPPAPAVAEHATWRRALNQHAGWQQPVARPPGARHRECPWGPEGDPVRLLELATTRQLGEGEAAPRWSLLAQLEPVDARLRSIQAPLAASFEALLAALSEAEGFASVRQAAEYRPIMETLTRSLLEPSASVVPPPEELNQMIAELFDKEHPAAAFLPSTLADAATLPAIKSAPPLSLLASLCMYLLNVDGLAAVAVVWLEFVKELRWHWDHFEPLPRTPFDAPGHAYSGLYQRLQMLNWCITQRRERNEVAKGTTAKRAALGGWSDAEEFESVSDGDDDDDDDDDEGDAKDDGREGVRSETVMRLLATGAVLCAPQTQDQQTFVTEDMIAEQQALLLSLGSDSAGSAQRAELQAQALGSDMDAFRAANPGCVLADFVRWHSGRDWVVSPCVDGDQTGGGEQPDGSWIYLDEASGERVQGRMSTRMGEQGNLWHQKWAESRPVPVFRQKSLVDHVREGERILHYLETMEPQVLLRQCSLISLSAAHHMFAALPASSVPIASRQIAALGAAMIDVGSEFANPHIQSLGPEDLQPCLVALERVERTCAAAASLLHKLEGNVDLANALLSGSRALVESDVERSVVQRLFTSTDELPPPHAREYLLRCLGPKGEYPSRMYAMVSADPDEPVRICLGVTSGVLEEGADVVLGTAC